MKKVLSIIVGSLAFFNQQATARDLASSPAPEFRENKGQLTDQHSQLRNDILYYGNSAELSYFFKNTGISYQLYEKGKGENQFIISRVDLTWIGSNSSARISAHNAGAGYDNFYNTSQPVTGVKSFGDLQYREIYPGIDLHYYYKNTSLKYDFLVAPGADYRKIRIKVEGATAVDENKDGGISITTPNGKLIEGKPVAFQDGKEIPTSWILEGDVLSFDVADHNPALPLVIDPLVYQWTKNEGTPSGTQQVVINYYRSVCDAYGNTYMAANKQGTSPNSTATYLNKYSNALGATVWSKSQYLPSSTINVSLEELALYGNDLYMCGRAFNVSTLATSGAYQTTISGSNDGFLAKLDTSGTKVWGTYYGGSLDDAIMSCKPDSAGYLFVSGTSSSTSNIASTGAPQTVLAGLTDAFIGKFNTSNGYRVWATYFGGNAADSAKNMEVRGNRLYISGNTKSGSGIATAGAHQTVYSGNINGFLLCMDTSGVTQWSTYYGADSTFAEKCVLTADAVYLSGTTNASTAIATAGTFQPAIGGATDGFLAKFNLSGVRQWGTYYGGTDRDIVHAAVATSGGRIYIGGNTKSTTGIATPNAYNANFVNPSYTMYSQPVGVAFIGELDVNGQRLSGTYVNGGTMMEHISTNSSNDLFVSGIAIMNFNDYASFFTRFSYCNASAPAITAAGTNVCTNSSILLSSPAVSGVSYQWYRNDLPINGATSNTYNATLAGTYKLIVDQCSNGISNSIVLTATAPPSTSIVKIDAACAAATNGSITVTPSGGATPYSYTWDNSTNTSATMSGLAPGNYIVHTSDANSCIKTDTVTIVNINNVPVSTATHTNVPCYGDPVATITVSTTGGTTPYAYAWDNMAAITPDISGLGTGTYVVHTTDANNCTDVDTIEVGQYTEIDPSNPLASICAVTVDSATGKNIVIWKKDGLVKATAYNIYRESNVSGQYNLIGTKDVGDDPVFMDNTAIPLQQSYIYKIAEVDSCDHEWPMSEQHKTIHLSSNVGVNGENNLSWNVYEGKPYTTHRIMRSFNDGPYILLNEVSAGITAYSDLTPPLGNNTYRIEVDLGPVCDSTASQYVVSNKQSIAPTGIEDISSGVEVEILPNPTTGALHIKGPKPAYLAIYDATGKLVLKKDNDTTDLDIASFAKGVYMVHLLDKSGTVYHAQKVVLQ